MPPKDWLRSLSTRKGAVSAQVNSSRPGTSPLQARKLENARGRFRSALCLKPETTPKR